MFRQGFLFLFLLIFLSSLIVFLTSFVLEKRSSFFGQAVNRITESEVSTYNSYLFASPLQAKAGNSERIRVTVFLLNGQGLGVSGQKVSLASDKGIQVIEMQPVTDNYGKAIFDVTAAYPGEYLIEASVNQLVLAQKVKVSFTP